MCFVFVFRKQINQVYSQMMKGGQANTPDPAGVKIGNHFNFRIGNFLQFKKLVDLPEFECKF